MVREDVIIQGRDQTGKAFKSATKNARTFGSSIKKTSGSLGLLALKVGAVVSAFYTLRRAFTWAHDAAKTQQESERRLAVALRNTGQEVRRNLDDLKQWAGQRQAITTFGDEYTLQLASIGVALGRLSGRDLKDAIEASQDFAVATGKDARTAMELLSRAAQGGTADFSRYGLVIKDVAPGMETFRAAVTKIRESMGGMSQEVGALGTSQMPKLKNAFGDLAEQVGIAVTESNAFRQTTAGVKTIVEGAAEALKRYNDAQREAAKWRKLGLSEGEQKRLSELRKPFLDKPTRNIIEGLRGVNEFYGRSAKGAAGFQERYGTAAQKSKDPRFATLQTMGAVGGVFSDFASQMSKGMVTAFEATEAQWASEKMARAIAAQEIWRQQAEMLGSEFTGAFSNAMVDAFDRRVGYQQAFKNFGQDAKNLFISAFTTESLSPINEAIGALAKSIASIFKNLVQKIADAFINPLASAITGLLGAVFGASTGGGGGVFGGFPVGKALGLQHGGIVMPQAGYGGVLTVLAEREPEAVIPLSKLEGMGAGAPNIAVNISGPVIASHPRDFARLISDALQEILREERLGGRLS